MDDSCLRRVTLTLWLASAARAAIGNGTATKNNKARVDIARSFTAQSVMSAYRPCEVDEGCAIRNTIGDSQIACQFPNKTSTLPMIVMA